MPKKLKKKKNILLKNNAESNAQKIFFFDQCLNVQHR